MKTVASLRAFSLSKQLTLTALFASLCLVGTLLIPIRLPTGYFNVGDVFVLLAGWCLGPLYGSVAAGLGSALADIIAGYAMYSPFTFIIKALDAFTAYMVWRLLKKCIHKERFDIIPRAISALIGESIMVAGYLLVDTIFYGFYGAIASVFGNALQGVCCMPIALTLAYVLYSLKNVSRLFPSLKITS